MQVILLKPEVLLFSGCCSRYSQSLTEAESECSHLSVACCLSQHRLSCQLAAAIDLPSFILGAVGFDHAPMYKHHSNIVLSELILPIASTTIERP